MECVQLLPGQEVPLLCQFFALGQDGIVWLETNISWVVATLGVITLFFTLWSQRGDLRLSQPIAIQTPQERAEILLQESITPLQYQSLHSLGYLELPSTLYPHRYYRIPRERRRVQVYEAQETPLGQQYQKLGELCVIACEPMPDADLVLTHKWLLEADEQKYLSIANWVR